MRSAVVRRPHVLLASILVIAGIVLSLLPSQPARAQSVMPPSPVGIPQLENAPFPVPLPANLPGVPVLTYPVIGPHRPAPEYGSVRIFPNANEVTGVAQPVFFLFDRPIHDRAAAEATLGIHTEPQVSGKFYWVNDSEVRWRPHNFWPPNTNVTIWAGGAQQNFRTGDAVVSTYDNNTKHVTVTRNGHIERVMRASTGRDHSWFSTYNGIYYNGYRGRSVRMSSEAFADRIDGPGYNSIVHDAVRLSYDGIYIHAAPWSLADQGVRNVSHGCINVSPEDAAWYYNNTRNGDPFIVINSTGRHFGAFDGQGDWNY